MISRLAAHYCPLLLVFSHFAEIWPKMSSNEQQSREITYIQRLQRKSSPMKKIWIKISSESREPAKCAFFDIFVIFGTFAIFGENTKKCQFHRFSELRRDL